MFRARCRDVEGDLQVVLSHICFQTSEFGLTRCFQSGLIREDKRFKRSAPECHQQRPHFLIFEGGMARLKMVELENNALFEVLEELLPECDLLATLYDVEEVHEVLVRS